MWNDRAMTAKHLDLVVNELFKDCLMNFNMIVLTTHRQKATYNAEIPFRDYTTAAVPNK